MMNGATHEFAAMSSNDLVSARLGRSSKSRCQGEGIGQGLEDRGLARGRFDSREQAGRSAAGKRAFHFPHPPAYPRRGHLEPCPRQLLQKEDSEIKGNGVEATRKHDARAGGLRGLAIFADHRRHPGRLPAEVHIVGAGRSTGRHQTLAVELIRPDRRNDHLRAFRQGFQRRRVGLRRRRSVGGSRVRR